MPTSSFSGDLRAGVHGRFAARAHRDDSDAQKLNDQVMRMLDLATSRHPEFEQDCLSDPWRIAEHWREEVRIERVGSITEQVLNRFGSVVDDDGSGVIGLFSAARSRRWRHRIQVQFKGEYDARSNFTLMHEIGHYLQQTDDELATVLSGIGSQNGDHNLEETACNRFASLALLPDSYVTGILQGHPVDAIAVNRLFDRGRSSSLRSVRVSRPVVARRMADFLQCPGTVTLLQGGRRGDRRVEEARFDECRINVRTHAGGMAEYEGDLTDLERDMLERLRKGEGKPQSHEFTKPDGTRVRASIAESRGRYLSYFIVIKEEPPRS
ncbi:ImmA/IrrE family metallo-endopeptidase [Bifidobacterium samirii]|uniref:Uncharacterized protein n=1 Tax=Bifidobacterium samirii TaxID=2306974 RepID=A0A430FCP6_9BIFI|nr:ImmA/IrrE family metallo-endopeptidase [Bifidobacterium samirii]RSX50607.1 hypothetical protein D2E24_1956 [Bifidobacterium samirii]